MSRNAIVNITAINAALSLTTRDFTSVLLVTKAKKVSNGSNLPKAITSTKELIDLGFQETDKEVILVRDFLVLQQNQILFGYMEMTQLLQRTLLSCKD